MGDRYAAKLTTPFSDYNSNASKTVGGMAYDTILSDTALHKNNFHTNYKFEHYDHVSKFGDAHPSKSPLIPPASKDISTNNTIDVLNRGSRYDPRSLDACTCEKKYEYLGQTDLNSGNNRYDREREIRKVEDQRFKDSFTRGGDLDTVTTTYQSIQQRNTKLNQLQDTYLRKSRELSGE